MRFVAQQSINKSQLVDQNDQWNETLGDSDDCYDFCNEI